jgi:pimeloyl-ACP methyl ester carboxylesterase
VPAVPTVTPNPPASYRPEWPTRTVRNAEGYLVDTCVPQRLRENAIAMTDSDGVHLSGLVLGTGPNGVLLSHEQGYNVCSFLPLAEELAARGFQVLLPEYRNHGASEHVADNEHLGRDAEAGLAELRRRGATRIFVGGASCGGTASILVGAEIPDLVGLLVMSSPARCGLVDAVPAVRGILAPSLFIVSPGDMNGAVEEQVRELYAASSATDKKLVIDDSGYHGTDMFRESDHGGALQRRVLRFVMGTYGA